MKVIKIISEHKRKRKEKPVKTGFKRVMAIVEDQFGFKTTRHIDISKNKEKKLCKCGEIATKGDFCDKCADEIPL